MDSTGYVGEFSSLAFGTGPAISYFDWTNEDLKFASYSTIAPTPTPTPTASPTPTPTPTLTPTPTPTPTASPTPTPPPGGGGPPLIAKLDVDLWGSVSSWDMSKDGVLLEDVNAISTDGNVTVHIAEGTTVLGPDSELPDEIGVTPVDPLPTPPEGYHVITAFDFEPDDATFDPRIDITIAYDPEALAEGVDESNLVIAFRNETTREWVFVDSVVDPDTNTVTYSIGHFTIFAMLVAAQTPTPTPTLTPTPTPTPTPAVGLGKGVGIGIGIGSVLVIVLLVGGGMWLRKRLGTRRQ